MHSRIVLSQIELTLANNLRHIMMIGKLIETDALQLLVCRIGFAQRHIVAFHVAQHTQIVVV